VSQVCALPARPPTATSMLCPDRSPIADQAACPGRASTVCCSCRSGSGRHRALRADRLYRPSTYPYRLFAFGLSAGAIPASGKRARRAAHLAVASLVYPLRARSLVHSAALHRSARPGMSLVSHTTCKHLAYGAPVCCGHG